MGMPNEDDLFSISFTEEALKTLKVLEADEDMHEVLNTLVYSIRRNPMAFPYQYPLTILRAAKSYHYERNGRILPKVIFFFQIINDDREVRVVKIQYKPADDSWHL